MVTVNKERRVEKASSIGGEKPTVPPNNDHTTGWSDTDTYERELLINLNDGKVYTREGSEVITLNVPNSIISPTVILLSNGTDPLKFTVEAFDYVIKGRDISHIQVIDEAVITDGDVANPRYDIVVIDEANVVSVVAGTPSANPIIPTVPIFKLLVGVVFVPTNHTVASPVIEPIQRDIFTSVQTNVIIDWTVGRTLVKGMYVNYDNNLFKVTTSHVSSEFVTDLQTNGYFSEIGSKSGSEDEWQESVLTIETDPSSLTPSVGDRHLIGASAVGLWAGRDGQISEWRGVKWKYVTPTDGMSVKVDTDDTNLYHHEGAAVDFTNWIAQPFGGGGSTLLTTPTDSTWDGLFDMTGLTHEDALDLQNVVLAALVPPSAPDLSDWTGSKSGVSSGKLSFDTLNPIGGYAPADAVGIPSPVSVDGAFNVSGKKLGIDAAISGDISGVLNDQVLADTQTPNAAYVADRFGKAELGSIEVYINGALISTLDLTSSTGAIDGTAGNTVTGVSVSAQAPSLFSSGNPFETFQNRAGTWLVKDTDLIVGYNDIIIKHDTGAGIFTLDRFEVIIDSDTTATAFSGEVLDTLVMSGTKKISGVDYHTGGTALYDLLVDNAYRNTYSSASDAVKHNGVNCSAPQEALANGLGDEAKQVVILDKVVTITASGIRIINGLISLTTTVKRTVQSNLTSTGKNINNILLDNVGATSTNTSESFDDENQRVPTNANFESIVGFDAWDGEQSIANGDAIAGYSDGMIVTEGVCKYPNFNYATANVLNGSVWNDGGTKGGARDYSALAGDKIYARGFFKSIGSGTHTNFQITVNGDGGINFVDLATALTGNNAHLEFKMPSQTGWMDGYKAFLGGTGDGDGAQGALSGGINSILDLTAGSKSSANTGGYIAIRITVGTSFSLEFTSITFTYN